MSSPIVRLMSSYNTSIPCDCETGAHFVKVEQWHSSQVGILYRYEVPCQDKPIYSLRVV